MPPNKPVGAPSNIAPPKIKGTASGVAGPYTKLSVVGKGAFGDIFLVRDTKKGGQELIMKQVQTKNLSPSEVRATKQETAVLKHVSHGHVILTTRAEGRPESRQAIIKAQVSFVDEDVREEREHGLATREG